MLFLKPSLEKIIARKDVRSLKKMLAKEPRALDTEEIRLVYRFGRASTPLLIECLSDDEVADRAVELLVDINYHENARDLSCINPILPQIVRALHHENERVRSRSALILTQMGRSTPPEPKLKKAAKDLVRSLKRQSDPVPVLIHELERRQEMPKRRGALSELGRFREWIVEILGGFGPEERIVSALTRSLLEDKDEGVYYRICKVLKEFGPVSGSVPALIEALRFPREDSLLAVEVLGSYEEAARQAVPHLIREYKRRFSDTSDAENILIALQLVTSEPVTWMKGEQLSSWFERKLEESSTSS